jgi:Holliday junction resolvase
VSNPNYARGANAERDFVKKKRQDGYASGRNAGSHSPIDVWAAKGGRIEFYQLKVGRRRWPSRDERFALLLEAERAGATPFVVFREPRKGWEVVPPEEWPEPPSA